MQYVSGIYAKRSFFAWATGVEAALADIDKVRCDELLAVAIVPPCLLCLNSMFAVCTSRLSATCCLPQTSADLAAMRAEHSRLESLAKLFDCTSLLDATAAAIRTTGDELAAIAAVWRQAEVAQARIATWNEQVGYALDA